MAFDIVLVYFDQTLFLKVSATNKYIFFRRSTLSQTFCHAKLTLSMPIFIWKINAEPTPCLDLYQFMFFFIIVCANIIICKVADNIGTSSQSFVKW